MRKKTKPIDFKILNRTVESYFSLNELKEKLKKGKPLNIKYGVDVTAPFLHIGHAVNLWTMRYFQECGHKVIFLIGDFTTRIGDPTGKSKLRKVIPIEEIKENAKEFIKQVGRVLLTENQVFEVRYNGSWYDKMELSRFFSLCSMITHSRLIQRDMFQKRIKEKQEIFIHEMLYPILQGYDSVELESDLTIVGTDQLFNELVGRVYQEKFDQEPQVVMTTKITPGTDGVEKQSKSLGNYIALEDTPKDKFGKIMSLPDFLIVPYLEVYTLVPLKEIETLKKEMEKGKNPMEAKKILAASLVERYHGKKVAEGERIWFEKAFSKREIPEDIPEIKIGKKLDFMGVLKVCMPEESKSSIVRLLKQEAVRLNGEKVLMEKELPKVKSGDILKVGKRRWFKIVF
jgi:tyrosyl-tRNA synthetase